MGKNIRSQGGRIFLLGEDDALHPMSETPYDSEVLLQRLLADHPDLMAGELIDDAEPRRWLLISREMSVPAEDDGAGRWSLDHLFLDQDGIPTLVEVKRSENTEIRRRVVGQLLDYAANAVVHWPAAEIRAKFEARCQALDEDPEDVLRDFLDEERDAEDFWEDVKTNLKAEKVRLIFVADRIPAELRRVIEFLNGQMDPAEVLGIEVRQYLGAAGKTLVPRVVGKLESKGAKRPGKQWDEESVLQSIVERHGAESAAVALQLLDHVRPPKTSQFKYGSGAQWGGITAVIVSGGMNYQVCRIGTGAPLVVWFDSLKKKPPFEDPEQRRAVLRKLNEIPGVSFGDDRIEKRAKVRYSVFDNPAALPKAKAALDFIIETIRGNGSS